MDTPKPKPLTLGALKRLLVHWIAEYGDDCELGLGPSVENPFTLRLYALDDARLTTKAPDYEAEVEGWGDLESARLQPAFLAHFGE